MSDALVSPAVAASMWVATSGATVLSARSLRRHPDDRQVPLMGVLGAFVFAAQMVNFTIPGTGSSGHLGGGLLLAILLGPPAGFLVMVSVLTVQALFFADGGLLALGCNIFNLGFFPSFLAFPLVFLPVAGRRPTRARLAVATVLSSVVGLQLGRSLAQRGAHLVHSAPATRMHACVTGSEKSPPGGETAPIRVTAPQRSGWPVQRTRPARSCRLAARLAR